MKVMTIIGARPQFIKAAVVSRALKESRPDAQEIIVHTGQHYDLNMSDIFFEELEIPSPHYNLEIGGGTHGENTGRMIERIEKIIVKENPNRVVVFGDTDSTLAGALAASKLNVPVAHIEAGLRSFNREMPEEINRVLTDHIADLLFVPTSLGRDNLKNEGISDEKIKFVGDVMYDATLFYMEKARKPRLPDNKEIDLGNFVLCTIHRAENTNNADKLRDILLGLGDSGRTIILPMHPRTRATIKKIGFSIPKNIQVIDPVGYLEMVWLEKNSLLIATDSGGIQKEAYFHGKPCITLRSETEWKELVDIGVNRLVGSDRLLISETVANSHMMENFAVNLYGNGRAALEICKGL